MKIKFNFILTAACLFSLSLRAAADVRKLLIVRVAGEENVRIISFTDKTTVKAVKDKIQESTGMLAEEQALFFTMRSRGGYYLPQPLRTELADAQLCSAYDLYEGATVECELRMRRHSH